MNKYVINPTFELNTITSNSIYQIMHLEKVVATISSLGDAHLIDEMFMPFDLYLEEGTSLETRMQNRVNFQHWCASRVLSLDRKYAKEIMDSLGVSQSTTDQDRAKISLSYHCVSLNDVNWVRLADENVTFKELNLYDHHLDDAIVPLPLKGTHLTVTNKELAQDLSTKGCFPKAWIRRGDEFYLLKDGGADVVKRELLASRICKCFDICQVEYEEDYYGDEIVSKSKIVTSKELSMVSYAAFDIYALNHDFDAIDRCIQLDPIAYYGMNILDYLVGNTDRHPENWGIMVDNATNTPISLYPLMDFNMSFNAYDDINGANCQTVGSRKLTQREAAIEAVKAIGLRKKHDVDLQLFTNMDKERDIFVQRLKELEKYCN